MNQFATAPPGTLQPNPMASAMIPPTGPCGMPPMASMPPGAMARGVPGGTPPMASMPPGAMATGIPGGTPPMAAMPPGAMATGMPGGMPPMGSMPPGAMATGMMPPGVPGPGVPPPPHPTMGRAGFRSHASHRPLDGHDSRPLEGPMGIPGAIGPFGPMPPPRNIQEVHQQHQVANYQWAAVAASNRLQSASARHHELVNDLNLLTSDEYTRQMRKAFTASQPAGLDAVDWRVPRLMYCKDPKYNVGVPPHLAFEVQERKLVDGRIIEDELSRETYAKFKKEADEEYEAAYRKSNEENAKNPETAGSEPPEPFKHEPPPEEIIKKKGVPFFHAVPNYQRCDDLWNRRLELRTMEEAMRGDVSQPLPRPVLFEEDFENFKQGKYVKDDCPIA